MTCPTKFYQLQPNLRNNSFWNLHVDETFQMLSIAIIQQRLRHESIRQIINFIDQII